ncbi:hypothetical protein FQ142_15580 [Microbacterium sp. ANT_H45B]|uniref:hypothetical protein n=1 Tax=Microbacterium sp. ANT_H45B TaxID=2597346 RepID=UPI0011EBDCB9|nr:hypothetical protein [Microbacterium sp. ANT_H45B]KAA0960248.1 hypothetical protein FQ142_15580 [Microbacterium sp. ANT_H45B]
MRPSLQLAGFLWTFLVRRILRRGMLRVTAVRWVLVAAVAAAFVGFCAFGVLALRQLIVEPEQLPPLLRVVGVSIPLWVLTAFTVVRVLFLKAGDLIELTFSFPLTNRARGLGVLLFETLLVAIAVTFALGAVVSGALSIGGVSILDDILTCVVLPAVVAYLLTSVAYLALERLLLRIRLARLRAFLVPVALAAAMAVVYLGVSAQSEPVLFAAVGQGDDYFAPSLVFADIAAAHGLIAALSVWAPCVALLMLAVIAMAPRQFEPTRRFAVVPRLFGSTEFGVYFSAHIRAIETITVIGLALAGSYALFLANVRLPPLLLIAVSVQSVYSFVSTESLRATGPRRHGPSMRYLLILGPQLATLALIAVPMSALSALTGAPADAILTVIGFAASNIVVLTLAGIAFPPEKGNPFSVIAGVAIAGLVVGTIMLGTNLLGLPAPFTVGVMVFLTLLSAALSIAGMDRTERTARHEVVVEDRRERGRSARRHRGGGDRHRDLVDVRGRIDGGPTARLLRGGLRRGASER